MVLVDHVEHWDATRLRATSARHRAPAHPLAGADGAVAAVHLLELAAQAAAIHIGLVSAGEVAGEAAGDADAASSGMPMPGMLAFARELSFAVASIAPDAPALRVEVTRRATLPGGMAYAFEVAHVVQDGSTHGAAGAPTPTPALGHGVFGVVFGAGASSGDSAPARAGRSRVDHEVGT